MTSSKIFLYFYLSFVFGVFLNSFFNFSLPALLAILILEIVTWRLQERERLKFLKY